MGEAMKRQRIPTRQKKVVVQKTERDIQLLTLVGLCKYVSSIQVARTFFAHNRKNSDRRLRKLYHAGLIDLSITGSRLPNLVTLTRPGLALLKKKSPSVATRCSRLTSIPLSGVEHHLGIVDVRLATAKRCQETPGWQLLRWENGRGDLYRQLGLASYRLQPDALFEMLRWRSELVCALEVDLKTEPLSVLTDKLDGRYDRALKDRVIDQLWVALKGGVERKYHVQATARRLGIGAQVVVLALADLQGTDSGGKVRPGAGGVRGLGISPNAQPNQPVSRCVNPDPATTIPTAVATTANRDLKPWRKP